MPTKVNGRVKAGEMLGSNLEFYSITTSVNILPIGASGDATSQAALDKLVEVISVRGQPVIMGTPYSSSPNYVFKFALEHAGVWTDAATLKAYIIANATAFASDSGMTVTIGDTIA